MTKLARHTLFSLLGAATLAGTFAAGVAYAADARLDQAIDSIDRAVSLLTAIDDPAEKPKAKLHRKAAIVALKLAKKETERSKQLQGP